MTEKKGSNPLNFQRKNPSQVRSKTLVSAVFEAATRILPKSGYDSVTTNQLAKIAGISVGSLYQYFSNKDEIFALLLEKNLVENKALLERIVLEKMNSPLREFIGEVVSKVVDLNLDHREFVSRLFIQAPRLNRVVRIIESRNQFIDLLVKALRLRDDKIDKSNLELTVYLSVHAVMGVIQTLVVEPDGHLDRQQIKTELTSLVVSYLSRDAGALNRDLHSNEKT